MCFLLLVQERLSHIFLRVGSVYAFLAQRGWRAKNAQCCLVSSWWCVHLLSSTVTLGLWHAGAAAMLMLQSSPSFLWKRSPRNVWIWKLLWHADLPSEAGYGFCIPDCTAFLLEVWEPTRGFLILVRLCERGKKREKVLWKTQIWSGSDWDLLSTDSFLDLCAINIVLATSTCSTNKVSSVRCHSLTFSVTQRNRPSICRAECVLYREEYSCRSHDLDNIWQDYASIHVCSAPYTLKFPQFGATGHYCNLSIIYVGNKEIDHGWGKRSNASEWIWVLCI